MSARTRWPVLAGALLGLALIGGVLRWGAVGESETAIRLREPGQDRPVRRRLTAPAPPAQVRIGEVFVQGEGVPADIPGTWPGFRGADRDNIVKDSVPLAETWPEEGPPVLWRIALGEGYAAPAVWNGRVYVLDYDETEKADMLRCLSLDDGRDIWRRGYRVEVKRNHGMSRTVPTVNDQFVVTLGPRGHVMCADAVTGDFRWGLDLEREYGASIPPWYTGQCPLLDGTTVVLAVGGHVLMMGVDLSTGEIRWSTPNPDGWRMSHASLCLARIGSRRQYVYAAPEGVVGVAAEGPEVGRVLWSCREWAHAIVVPTPLPLGEGRLFLTAGYAAGGAVLEVREAAGEWLAELRMRYKPAEGLSSEQQTPLLHDGCLYGIMPKDAGALRGQFVCVSAEDPRHIRWSSGRTERFGLGPYLMADGKIFILDDDGVLTLIRASPHGYERLARARVLFGEDSWGPLVLVSGRLLARDTRSMVCLDVSRDGVSGRERRGPVPDGRSFAVRSSGEEKTQ